MQFLDIKNGRFYLGDCLEVMKEIPDGVVDMLLVDLPYGTTACSWDSIIPFEPLWEQYNRICKENAAMVFTAAQPFTTALVASNIDNFKYNWVWIKPQGVDPFMAKKRPLNNIEDILVFCKGSTPYFPQIEQGKPYSVTRDKKPRIKETNNAVMKETTTVNNGTRLPKRTLEFKQQKGMHPTQKPVELFEYLIKTYTNEGELILDNCAGSGTTAIAAENTGRKWVCIEQSEEYATKAVERILNHTPEEMPTNSGVKIDDSIPIPEGE
jgi:site-specific DNA-methyltransferase (adenine-specific)